MADCSRNFNNGEECYRNKITLGSEKEDQLRTSRNALRKKVKSHLEGKGAKDVKFYRQGSYAHRTIVNPLDGDYDIDDGVYMDLSGFENEPSTTTIHNWIVEAVEGHTDIKPNDREPCVRAIFKAGYHVDLPAYKIVQENDKDKNHLAKKAAGWEESNPRGMNNWFQQEVKNKSPQVRRVVKYLKGWKDFRKSKSSAKLPSGLTLTILATEEFVSDIRDDISFSGTNKAVLNRLKLNEAIWKPYQPTENMRKYMTDGQFENFLEELEKLVAAGKEAIGEDNARTASEKWRKVLGERFHCPIPIKVRGQKSSPKHLLLGQRSRVPNLHMTYKETLRIAQEEVESLFQEYRFERLPEGNSPSSGIIAAWKGSIQCEGERIIITVALPFGFPDKLPKVYLAEDFKHYPIPHVDSNRFVCTFNTENVDFFAENPKGLIAQTIEKARTIISDGIAGRNQEDFEQEFFAYWNTEASSLTLHSILAPGNSINEISLAPVKSSSKEIKFLIGSNRDDIIEYARKLDPKSATTNFKSCLYLPLPIIPTPPLPKTNKEVFLFLRDIDPKLEQSLLNFLLKNNYVGTVIASVRVGDNVGLIGWLHQAPKKSLIVKGFRPGKVSPSVYEQRTAALEITRYPVERLDADRLQRRIGNFGSTMKDKRICIVGVGSIGSNLAFELAKWGVEDLVLIDPENLKPENVARHLCGMSQTGLPKVEAAKKRIEQHLPHVKLETHAKSLYQILIENADIILRSDLIISATGNLLPKED